MSEQQSIEIQILDHYRSLVANTHPDKVSFWPVLSGYNFKIGTFGNWLILIFEHTGNPVMISKSGLGELPGGVIGVSVIDNSNKNLVRSRIEKHFYLKPSDAIVIAQPPCTIDDELRVMLQKHEFAMGLVPMKIFLSHKGADKALVREFKNTLALLGFDPWLDEDALSAGIELERGILQGFRDSCAAVFFVTPNFRDENYLATEVNYAIAEKRRKGEKFAIITLVFTKERQQGTVPDLLRPYVWKEPSTELEAFREIIKALPVKVGDVYWRT
jgi:hypothetical protein